MSYTKYVFGISRSGYGRCFPYTFAHSVLYVCSVPVKDLYLYPPSYFLTWHTPCSTDRIPGKTVLDDRPRPRGRGDARDERGEPHRITHPFYNPIGKNYPSLLKAYRRKPMGVGGRGGIATEERVVPWKRVPIKIIYRMTLKDQYYLWYNTG